MRFFQKNQKEGSLSMTESVTDDIMKTD